MKDAIEAGAVDPRSSMGVLFRNEHAKGTPDGDVRRPWMIKTTRMIKHIKQEC